MLILSIFLGISEVKQQKMPGGGGTPLYKVYSYVPPQRVWFLIRFGLKTGIDFEHFGLKLGLDLEMRADTPTKNSNLRNLLEKHAPGRATCCGL